MKSLLIKFLFLSILSSIFFVRVNAQQSEIEHNSDSSSPTLLLKETESNDFVRLWFQTSSPDKWAFNAKPTAGTSDNDNILNSPLIWAYNGVQRFGIGSNGLIRINKEYTLPNIDGSAGQVLTTDGAGTSSWTSPSSSIPHKIEDSDGDTYLTTSLYGDDDKFRFFLDGNEIMTIDTNDYGIPRIQTDFGTKNVLIGGGVASKIGSVFGPTGYNTGVGFASLLLFEQGSNNTAIGSWSMANYKSGHSNTAIGYKALENAKGNYNTALGVSALSSIGSNCVGVGASAGFRADTLSNNSIFIGNNAGGSGAVNGPRYNLSSSVFIGAQAGYQAMDSKRNVLIGQSAGRLVEDDENVMIGFNSGYNSTGKANLFLGSYSGYSTSGEQNVFLGFDSGRFNTNGNNNVFIGFKSGRLETGSEKLYIENSDSSNPLIYGEFNNDLVRINGDLEITQSIEVTGTVKISDVLNLPILSTPPSNPEVGDVYLDDGTNTASVTHGLRLCISVSPDTWVDL